MLFNSYEFLFAFLPVAVAGYYILGAVRITLAKIWVVACSLVFYAWWSPHFVVLLMISVGFNFFSSKIIEGLRGQDSRQTGVLILAVIGNLSLLGYYKYLPAALGFMSLHGVTVSQTFLSSIVLPLGISFFTFTQIGYLVDCRQGVASPTGALDYALFVTFFPHLVAGPILHHQEIIPQISRPETYAFSVENFSVGATLTTFGLCKKVILADPLGVIADQGFAAAGELGMIESWIAALSYSLQIYFDFSGYSDMAIGLARLYGVRFPVNFNSPYKAASIIDYWQRWHMTLTRYVTMYIYNPLALWVTRRRIARGLPVSRKATANLRGFATLIVAPMTVTMLVAGLWHGAGATFVLFGLMHAVYLTTNHAWRIFHGGKVRHRSVLASVSAVTATYLCVLASDVVFRAKSVGEAWVVLEGMLGLHSVPTHIVLPARLLSTLGPLGDLLPSVSFGIVVPGGVADLETYARLALSAAIVWAMPNTQELLADFSPGLSIYGRPQTSLLRWKPNPAWGISVGLMFLFGTSAIADASKFLYFQF